LSITDPSVTLTDFGVTFGSTVSFEANGTVTVAAASASFNLGGVFTSTATGLSISVSLNPSTFGAVQVTAATLNFQLSIDSARLSFDATNITINTEPENDG